VGQKRAFTSEIMQWKKGNKVVEFPQKVAQKDRKHKRKDKKIRDLMQGGQCLNNRNQEHRKQKVIKIDQQNNSAKISRSRFSDGKAH
jgi:hypothetical protein